jgi:hypothetical protein
MEVPSVKWQVASSSPGKTDMRLMFWCLKRNGMRSLLVPNLLGAQLTARSTCGMRTSLVSNPPGRVF